jgi:hypothetical protein
LQPIGPVNELSREQLIEHAVEKRKVGQVWNAGSEDNLPISDEETCLQIASVLMPIRRSYVLAGCISGEVSLALNGRTGRRVACVLDRKEAVLEVLDIEGETDDESWDEDGEET